MFILGAEAGIGHPALVDHRRQCEAKGSQVWRRSPADVLRAAVSLWTSPVMRGSARSRHGPRLRVRIRGLGMSISFAAEAASRFGVVLPTVISG